MSTATLTVTVLRNNNAPIFTRLPYYKTVSDTTPVLVSIFQVTATDSDTGKNAEIRYKITGPIESQKLFEMNATTGTIYVRSSLTGVSQDRYTINVEASDSGSKPQTSTAKVVISILHSNKPYFDRSMYEVSVDETAQVNAYVFQVSANDPRQSAGQLQYEMINNVKLFAMSSGGLITVAKPLVGLNINIVEIEVKAFRKNDTSSSATTTVIVKIIRRNTPPRFNSTNVEISIADDTTIGHVFYKAVATDPDTGENGRITYKIITYNPPSGKSYFYVNPETGNVTVTALLSQNPNPTRRYILDIQAEDNGYPRNKATMRITVNVVSRSNIPVFQQSEYKFNITSKAVKNDVVGTVSATDRDGDQVIYSIPQSDFYFAINNITGVITVNGDIASNPTSFYEFNVKASDGSYRYSEARVIITVKHNLYPPVFSKKLYEVYVKEYIPIDTAIIQVTATDKDLQAGSSTANALNYYISPFSNYFSISNFGNIYVRASLATNLIGNQVNLTVIATDQSLQPMSGSTLVIVNIERNSYPPVLQPSSISVSILSTFTPTRTILKLNVSDQDRSLNNPNGEVILSIPDKYADARKYFAITNQGDLYLETPLSITDSRMFNFKVIAKDGGWNPKTAEASITINVTKVIQSGGKMGFVQPVYYVTIPENTKENAIILAMKVENTEKTNSMICKIQTGDEGLFSVKYNISTASCDLSLLNGIDYETKDSTYNLEIVLSTSQTRKLLAFQTYPTALVIVRVTDVNEHSPEFVANRFYQSSTYFGLLPSTAGVNTFVMSVNATDKDLYDKYYLTYSIVSSKTIPFYMLGRNILNSDVYKQNDATNYYFDVKVIDRGQKPATNKAVINIVFDDNRMSLKYEVKPSEFGKVKQNVRQILSEKISNIVLFEDVQIAYDENGNAISDITFVIAQQTVPHRLINIPSNDKIREEFNKLGDTIGDIGSVITTYQPQRAAMKTKSFVWWMDDPWAALVALAAIIILLCLIGIIVVLFTWSRYTKYLNQYRIHHLANEPTDFVEPPNFLKDFETQSLNMYVPPDEAERDLGEINMTFEGDTLRRVEHQGADPGVASAVNPLFNNQPQDTQQKTGFTETTTIL
ncbi:cadherin EGF LAG seven-pass G-type receptor 2-like [Octopus bimaculoides]|nr:cadherin EGF LAG seven-pass G-type receptor 2-like [Octopus bimaculoides]